MTEKAIVKQMPEPDPWREKVDLIKRTVARGVTDDELQLFLYTANRTGLDPLARQIHAVKRWNTKENREVMTVQTGIDGYRLIADRTGKHAGTEDAQYDTETAAHPGKATVTVHKIVDGESRSFTATARWSEYVQTNKDKVPIVMWEKMPYLMLGKCAEALALRKAFPAELAGVFVFEEMQQNDNDQRTINAPHQDEPPQVQRKSQTQAKPEGGDVPIQTNPGCISEKQLKMLFAIQKSAQIPDDAVKAIINQYFKVEHRNQIPKEGFGRVLEAIDPEHKYHTPQQQQAPPPPDEKF